LCKKKPKHIWIVLKDKFAFWVFVPFSFDLFLVPAKLLSGMDFYTFLDFYGWKCILYDKRKKQSNGWSFDQFNFENYQFYKLTKYDIFRDKNYFIWHNFLKIFSQNLLMKLLKLHNSTSKFSRWNYKFTFYYKIDFLFNYKLVYCFLSRDFLLI